MDFKVKICGLKEKEDILFVDSFGPDFVGFVFYPPSPRYVGKDFKEKISLVRKAKKVGVFVNPEYSFVKKALDAGIDFVQLHGEESPDFAKRIGLSRVIKAFRIGEKVDFKGLLEEMELWKGIFCFLLDTYVKGKAGGTGKTFDWKIAEKFSERGIRFFLAGGINLDNLREAVLKIRPYGIDLSSGVEERPGKKDFAKIEEFFRIVRELKGNRGDRI